MPSSADFELDPGNYRTSVVVAGLAGTSYGALAALVTIALETTIVVQATEATTDAGSTSPIANGLSGRAIKLTTAPQFLLLNESYEPITSSRVLAYDTVSGQILATAETNLHGVATFEDGDIVATAGMVVGYKAEVTRQAGKFGNASNNGASHLLLLNGGLVLEAATPTLSTNVALSGTPTTVISFDLSSLTAAERQGDWLVWTTFSFNVSTPD